MRYGERNSNCSLSDKDIQEIKKLHKEGLSMNKIAKKFYISQPYVSMLINGKRRSK